ncbi:hypothetical protein BFG07_16430 [Kosakonia cowanii]|uniref:hypothetical protein n=1 Tax=Kosakonia cowanii TaxID=208223 RepID=UPI000B96ADE6|nr:hypothetical protein [Kosakonia cowanii]AST70111.1 hypothetical protein BFG07_16430 [Kosakonia cowanii]
MTNNDELAMKLKQTAQLVHDNEQISNYGKLEAWKVRFRHTASPANILTLLAERDADKKRIAELEDNRTMSINPMGLHGCSEKTYWVANVRIAELEARTVRLNAADIINVAEGKNYAPGRMIPIDTLGDYCADAGIKLEVGE